MINRAAPVCVCVRGRVPISNSEIINTTFITTTLFNVQLQDSLTSFGPILHCGDINTLVHVK